VRQPDNLNQLFFGATERFSGKRAAVRYKAAGEWRDLTHRDLERRVRHIALGLRELGTSPRDRVAILSHNRPEWAIADFACLAARCADVPVYPTLPAPQVAYILQDAGVRIVFVEDRTQFEKVAAERGALPALEHVIVFDGSGEGAGVQSFEELLALGAEADSRYPNYRDEAIGVDRGELATLIYTSGTTGPPKGVMLSHYNFCSNVVGALRVLPIGPDDSCLSLLPLSHSFERMAGHYTMFHAGVTINYAEGVEQVPDNLLEVKPSVVLSVPRLFEKIYARVLENALAGGALKRRIFFWARRNAETWASAKLAGQAVPATLAVKKALADRLVFSKLAARTGGRVRYFVSGGAPLSPEIAKFFYAAGLPILEGYGLTETSPVICVNTLEDLKIGTVGRPIPGVDVRIADDGEVLVKGPNVMTGYYNRPDASRETIDADGWLHTGDIGELDADGFLKITDRKKDIIVTAGGKNIAPQPIENMVKTNKFILNAVMIGDKRKFPSMLVVPDIDALRGWAGERNLDIKDSESFLTVPDVVAKMEREVMGNLRDLAGFEMPKKILLVAKDFTIEEGELTPTLKVKRRVVEEKYEREINALYEE
jgi:long-chain acyl-CoA synthetase